MKLTCKLCGEEIISKSAIEEVQEKVESDLEKGDAQTNASRLNVY